jgi:hypothetical protein
MVAIPVQSAAGVIVAVPPSSSAGKEEEIVAPESPGKGGLGSPAWSELEEDEGATPALVNVETETGSLAECEGVRTQVIGYPDQEGDSSALEGSLE